MEFFNSFQIDLVCIFTMFKYDKQHIEHMNMVINTYRHIRIQLKDKLIKHRSVANAHTSSHRFESFRCLFPLASWTLEIKALFEDPPCSKFTNFLVEIPTRPSFYFGTHFILGPWRLFFLNEQCDLKFPLFEQ